MARRPRARGDTEYPRHWQYWIPGAGLPGRRIPAYAGMTSLEKIGFADAHWIKRRNQVQEYIDEQ